MASKAGTHNDTKTQKQKDKTRTLRQKVTFNNKKGTISQRVRFASFLCYKKIYFCLQKGGCVFVSGVLTKTQKQKVHQAKSAANTTTPIN